MMTLPHSPIRVLAPVDRLAFIDSQSVRLGARMAPCRAWLVLKTGPDVRALSLLWRALAGRCDGPDGCQIAHDAGDVLVMADRRRHLDVMICISAHGALLTVTVSATACNRRGRLAGQALAPVFRWVLRRRLARLQPR